MNKKNQEFIKYDNELNENINKNEINENINKDEVNENINEKNEILNKKTNTDSRQKV